MPITSYYIAFRCVYSFYTRSFIQQSMPNQTVLCHSHQNKIVLKPFSLSQKASDSWTQKDGHNVKTVATKKRVQKVVLMQVFHQAYPIWGLNTI